MIPWLSALALWVTAVVWARLSQIRRALARRERLGAVSRAAPEHDGEVVVLEGVLEARESVRRFEDGAKVVVASVRAGEKLVARVQADGITLRAKDGTRTALDGPLEIALGSVERLPEVRIERLSRPVRERIAEAGGEPRGKAPWFQSLAAGETARVRGTLRVDTEAHTSGYRERDHHYTLGGKLQAAHAGTPNIRGSLGSYVRGPRPASAFALVLLASAVALGAAVWFKNPPGSTHPRPESSAKPFVSTPKACEALAKRYASELESATACSGDVECVAEARGEKWFALDHCFRFVRHSAPELRSADAVARQWLESGCASDYDTCRMPPPAQCFEGHCRELPPNGLPRDWRRQRVGWLYSVFTPPDTRVTSGGEDSIVRTFEHPGFRLSADYGQWSGLGPEEDSGAKLEERLIDGRKVTIESTPNAITFWAGNMPPCPANRCGLMSFGQNRLTFYAECSTPEARQTVRTIVETLEVYGD